MKGLIREDTTLLGHPVELSLSNTDWEIHAARIGVFLCEDFTHMVQSISMLRGKGEQIDYLVVPAYFFRNVIAKSYPLELAVN